LLVLAGAGSGKTRVITYRIAYLLAHRVAPYRIYAVTFTNKAAKEMRSRIERLVGSDLASDLWLGTFHATCARLLRRYHDTAGLRKDFVIYDDSDQRAVMTRVVNDLNLDDRRFPPKLLLSMLHSYKQQGTSLNDIPVASPADQTIANAFAEYQRKLLAANAVDFDDLIIHVMNAAEDRSSIVGEELRSRFDHLLVDEFQDVNPVQYRLVRALATDHHSVCVVGDDDQSIYRWRGADIRIIRGFKNDFAKSRIVKLEQNYRSSGNVVRTALAVIKPSREREPKELFTTNPPGTPVKVVATRDEKDEGSWVVNAIQNAMAKGTPPNEIAVFYRIHAQSRVIEEALRSHAIPYQIIGGMRFFDRAEVKDVLAYLRVLVNPTSDVDLLRIINVPARQIGATTVNRLVLQATTTDRSVYDVLTSDLHAAGLNRAACKRVAAFGELLKKLRDDVAHLGPRALAEQVLHVTGYESSLLADDTPESLARIENLQELLGSLSEYEDETLQTGTTPSLSGYLERVSLISDIDQMQDAPRISMMTVHGSKGLEFDNVIVTGFEEGLFPYHSATSASDPEEERRLAYVAFTRARRHLTITHTASRMIFGSYRFNQPSTFLLDLPSDAVVSECSPALAHVRTPSVSTTPTMPTAPGERYVELDDNESSLAPGRTVMHQRYGTGTILSVDAGQTPAIAFVSFPAFGKKRIVVSHLRPSS